MLGYGAGMVCSYCRLHRRRRGGSQSQAVVEYDVNYSLILPLYSFQNGNFVSLRAFCLKIIKIDSFFYKISSRLHTINAENELSRTPPPKSSNQERCQDVLLFFRCRPDLCAPSSEERGIDQSGTSKHTYYACMLEYTTYNTTRFFTGRLEYCNRL